MANKTPAIRQQKGYWQVGVQDLKKMSCEASVKSSRSMGAPPFGIGVFAAEGVLWSSLGLQARPSPPFHRPT